MSWLAAHELVHLCVGAAAALVVWRLTLSRGAAIFTVVWSLLIDVDHLVDYFLALGLTFDLSAIVSGSYFASTGRLYVPFHSWELSGALLLLGVRLRHTAIGSMATALSLATIGHLIVDQLTYGVPLPTYLLVVRLLHGFSVPETWNR